jgi:8-oxo-dGTP pyrophosphatase MutT (NUDIX family)
VRPIAPRDSSRARTAGVVLLRSDGAALLQLRDDKPGLSAPGHWVFPGGGCECDESFADCARREFHEETGYACAALHPLTEFAYECPDVARSFWLSFWWCRYDGVSPVHCFEGQEVRFVPRSEAASLRIPDYLPGVWDLALAAAGVKNALPPA